MSSLNLVVLVIGVGILAPCLLVQCKDKFQVDRLFKICTVDDNCLGAFEPGSKTSSPILGRVTTDAFVDSEEQKWVAKDMLKRKFYYFEPQRNRYNNLTYGLHPGSSFPILNFWRVIERDDLDYSLELIKFPSRGDSGDQILGCLQYLGRAGKKMKVLGCEEDNLDQRWNFHSVQ